VRDFLVALSLANLLFLRAWEKARFGSYLDDFKPDGVTVALLVLLTCALLWIGRRLTRSSKALTLTAKILFLALLLIPVNALRLYYQQDIAAAYTNRYDWIAWFAFAAFVAPIPVAALTRRLGPRFLVRYGITLTLVVAPFTLFTIGGVALDTYRVAKKSPAALQRRINRLSSVDQNELKNKRQRVVWIIFDELDERTAFQERPQSVSMPELDRFRSETLVAANAYPPGNGTIISIPALLNGSQLASVTPRGDDLALLLDADSKPVIWNGEMTVFSEVSAAALKTGLVGAFLPYRQTICSVVDDCRDFRSARANESLGRKVTRTVVTALDAVPFAFRRFFKGRNEIERYEFIIHQASPMAADSKFDLVFLHFPLPHPPGIYTRASGRLEVAGNNSYLDNLALTDKTFGEVRRAMERAGVWQQSVVIVSADHWWRAEEIWRSNTDWTAEEERAADSRPPDHRVPFMVKPAGISEPYRYDRPFNTVLTRRMVMAFLSGEVASTKDLTAWLERQ